MVLCQQGRIVRVSGSFLAISSTTKVKGRQRRRTNGRRALRFALISATAVAFHHHQQQGLIGNAWRASSIDSDRIADHGRCRRRRFSIRLRSSPSPTSHSRGPRPAERDQLGGRRSGPTQASLTVTDNQYPEVNIHSASSLSQFGST